MRTPAALSHFPVVNPDDARGGAFVRLENVSLTKDSHGKLGRENERKLERCATY
jgi:hypothetical protein